MPRCFRSSLLFLVAVLTGCVNSLDLGDRRQTTSVKDGCTITRNIIYTPGNWPEPVLGDLYRPRATQPAPAVLLVHGGGWTGKDGRWQMTSIARKLAKRGYVVLNVTYRLAPRWTYPAPVEDLQAAVKWLRAHAAENGIDPGRIATFGYSAGGYLAYLTGMTEGPESSHIRAIVAGGAPSDLTFYAGGDLVPQFLGGTQQEIPQRFKEASPVNHVTDHSPPIFIYQGTDDRLVRPEHALAMIAALQKHRVPHETYWIEGRDHIAAFLLPAGSVDAAIDFLDRHMR
ncbi:MAG: alpha/beta hydrolase [Verrucomicrobiota bacterium]